MIKSDFDYDQFFKVLENYNYRKMIAIEVENRLNFKADTGFTENPILPQNKIIDAYNSEIDYLSSKLFWI